MPRRFYIQALVFAFCVLASAGLRAEVLDRIVAIVESHVITLSDVRQEREIRSRLGEKPIADDRALIAEMVDNQLIDVQMEGFPGMDVTGDEVDAELARSGGTGGIEPSAFRAAIRRRLRMTKYFNVRFRQFLQASDDEAHKYYTDVFVPEAQRRGVTPVSPFEQVEEAIKNNVVEEKLDHEVNAWLDTIRRRSDVEIFE